MRPSAVTISALVLGLALAGCGGGSSPAKPSAAGSTVDRAAITQLIVTSALRGTFQGSVGQRSVSGQTTTIDRYCQKTCLSNSDAAAATCNVTCAVDETVACEGGGTATNKGQVQGTLDAQLSGVATLSATQTYLRCRSNAGLTIESGTTGGVTDSAARGFGAGTTANGQIRFVNGDLADRQTVHVSGTVQSTSRPTTSDDSATNGIITSSVCQVDLDVQFSGSSGMAVGNVCDGAVETAVTTGL